MRVIVKSLLTGAFLTLAIGLSAPALAQNPNPSSANGPVASIAGTSWNAVETDGDIDIFTFMPDGSLEYSYQAGSFKNGTWKQDGDAVYMEMNNKYVEYHGRITGTHMEGTAHNVKDKDWTWKADKR